MARRLDAEPIPAFNEATRKRFDACLEQIKLPYYEGLITKAANLFYLISKNHPLGNGNKRMAVACLVVFLAFNGKRLVMKQTTMVKLARWLVQTEGRSKDAVISALEIMIENAIEDLPPELIRAA